jgi:hypothetical protein
MVRVSVRRWSRRLAVAAAIAVVIDATTLVLPIHFTLGYWPFSARVELTGVAYCPPPTVNAHGHLWQGDGFAPDNWDPMVRGVLRGTWTNSATFIADGARGQMSFHSVPPLRRYACPPR